MQMIAIADSAMNAKPPTAAPIMTELSDELSLLPGRSPITPPPWDTLLPLVGVTDAMEGLLEAVPVVFESEELGVRLLDGEIEIEGEILAEKLSVILAEPLAMPVCVILLVGEGD